uniref:Olfactory receptor 18-like n=1 Tax=Castor canadensis TaxID=51338 RepID=A0A8B7WI81_CASCN|nr:olfactory receptor 18-like [Castor canadensis]
MVAQNTGKVRVCLWKPALSKGAQKFQVKEKGSFGLSLWEVCGRFQVQQVGILGKRCSSNIEGKNITPVSEFHLLGLSEVPELQPVLFGLFLSMHLVTVLGNLLIILAISCDSHLHTPMYFFLYSLTLADICFISTTVPNLILVIQIHSRVISCVGCLMQMSIYIIFGSMDDMLLTVMAYDRFVAICHPLHYPVIMNTRVCVFLIFLSLLVSILNSKLHNLLALQFNNFKGAEISNFFCDPSHVFNLICSDTFSKNIVKYTAGVIFGFFPISGIILSYYKIISSIQKTSPTGGKYIAFSTCGSHLSVVCLFYGTSIGVYLGSGIQQSPREVLVASVIHIVVNPMLNPFIYCLRNRDIKCALRRIYRRTIHLRV